MQSSDYISSSGTLPHTEGIPLEPLSPSKTGAKAEKIELVHLTNKGAAKTVWIAKELLMKDSSKREETPVTGVLVSKDQIGPYKDSVFYTPKKGLISSKEDEIRGEFQKKKTIKEKLSPEDLTHLDLEFEEMAGEGRVGGDYTLKVDRAECDLEDLLRQYRLSTKERIKLAKDFLHGLNALHKAGFYFNDIKPENCLIYRDKEGNLTLKLSDLGKANTKKLLGNTRFASPSGGDMYGAGMVLIRLFEEHFLDKDRDSLIPNTSLGFRIADILNPSIKKIRGIEKYVIKHRAFKIANYPGTSFGLINRRRQGNYTDAEKDAQEKAMSTYIQVLQTEMAAELSEEQIKSFGAFLRLMTKSTETTSSTQAVEMFDEIFSDSSTKTESSVSESDKDEPSDISLTSSDSTHSRGTLPRVEGEETGLTLTTPDE